MNYRRQTNPWILVLVLVVGVVAALTWFNYRYAQQNPGGNDFLVHWMGTHTFLTEGLSPYSDETAERIQIAAYGRPARAGEHELRVSYPLYSIVVFLPYALISDYNLARAAWMTTLEIALVALSLMSMRLANWKPRPILLGLFLLFSLFWYHGFRPLINGNAIILVALCIAGGLLALKSKADELAGVLFAFATIKPHVVLLFLVFIAYWTYIHRRWRVVGWLVTTVILLSASAALLVPDWILQNIREIVRYSSYNPPLTLRAALTALLPGIGNRIGLAIMGLLALLLLVEWWLVRKANFRGFTWVACLTLVASQWIGIPTDPGNFIILLPALALIFALWQERWERVGSIFAVLSMLVLLAGLWGIFLATVEYGDQPQQSPIMFIPLPAFLLIMLYWVRWWAFKFPKVWFDQFYALENPDE
ncbi:MAG: DUF2029 domain-containing protein [Chloroflexi bacterium]|nr:DUF2029 domain-containing protein [Chloroflexota bacterium]